MRTLILMAAVMCCHAAPQMGVPLVYSAASAPWSITPASNSFTPFVGGGWPFMATSPSLYSQSPALRYAAAPVPVVPALPIGLTAMQYRSQDELGNVAFNHAGGPNSRAEFRTPFGAQVGSFSYVDGAGKLQHRTYVADAFGTRMTGTDLPEAPKETPEVARMRAALQEMRAAGSRNRRSLSTPPLGSLAAGTPIRYDVTSANNAPLPLAPHRTMYNVVTSSRVSPSAVSHSVPENTPAVAGKPVLKTIDTLFSTPVDADPAAPQPQQAAAAAAVAKATVASGARPSTLRAELTLSSPLAKDARVAGQPSHSAVPVKSATAVAAVAAASPAVALVAPMPSPMEAPSPPAPSPEVPFRGGKFHSQDELGQYSFGQFGGSHTRLEDKDFHGHTRGSFAYLDPEGHLHVRKYAAASGLGFTVAGSDLPVDTNKPVGYTPEVAKARKAHFALKQAEKRAKAQVESAGPAVTKA